MSTKTFNDSGSKHKKKTKSHDLTLFTTADKLTISNEKEVLPKSSVIDDTTKKSKTSKTPKSKNTSPKGSKKVRKEVLPRSKNDLPNKTKELLPRSKASKLQEPNNDTQDILKKYKRSTNQSNLEEAYLSIIHLLKSGIRPSKISSMAGVPKTTVQNHLNALKKRGAIRKAGYGVWEVIDNPESTKKRSTTSIYVAKNTPPAEIRQNLHMFIPDSVRAHAFLFTLQVPKDLRNWTNEKREQYLDKRNIPYKHLNIAGGGQRLVIDGRKTHLTNRSIVMYDKASYFAEKAVEAKSDAIHSFISTIKKLERLLHVELTTGSEYKWRVSRQHYAMVKNALAEQYNDTGEKLEVRSEGDNSLWFLIDNSFNLNEAEAVHPKAGMTDATKVQNFFNSVKTTGATIHSLLELNHGIQELQAASAADQAAFAADLRTHVDVQKKTAELQQETTEVLQKMGAGVHELTVATQELLKAVAEMGGKDD